MTHLEPLEFKLYISPYKFYFKAVNITMLNTTLTFLFYNNLNASYNSI